MPEALIDTHVHLDTFDAEGRVEELLDAAIAAGVPRMIAIGGRPSANDVALAWGARRPELAVAVGLDRDEAGKDEDWDRLRDQARRPGVVAVGECGLDYFYSPERAAVQRRCFEGNLALALEAGLPAVIHSRDADEDTLAILRAHARAWPNDPARIGVLHCYTRDKAMARKLLDLGYTLSFSGILTFANADMLREVAAYVPSDRLLVETDSPYLAPAPLRGKRTNQPAYLPHIVRKLAECRGEPEEEIARVTTRNAELLFRMR
jgi:TatD DNase family protein